MIFSLPIPLASSPISSFGLKPPWAFSLFSKLKLADCKKLKAVIKVGKMSFMINLEESAIAASGLYTLSAIAIQSDSWIASSVSIHEKGQFPISLIKAECYSSIFF